MIPDTPAIQMIFSTQTTTKDSSDDEPRITGPVQFVLKLKDLWGLSTDEVAVLLGLDSSEGHIMTNILDGIEPLRAREMKDRVAYLLQIRMVLDGLLQDNEAENH